MERRPDTDPAFAGRFLEDCYGDVLWAINKTVLDPHARDRIGEGVAYLARASCGFPLDRAGDELVMAFATGLRADGVVEYPAMLTPREVSDMRAHFESCGERIPDLNLLNHRVPDVMRAPHIWKLVANTTLLESVQHYLGAPPTVVDVSAWWAMPQASGPQGAQIYHRDVNDFRSCKMFFYLADCGPEDGPHVFVKRSGDPEHVKVRLSEAGLDPADYMNLFAGSGRHLAPHIDRVFGPDVTEMVGPAGTCFVEDTYGFHRAKVPTRGARLLVQALYTLIDYPHRMKTFEPFRLKQLPMDVVDAPLTRYALRMMMAR